MILAQGLSWGCSKNADQGCTLWGLDCGWRVRFQDGALTRLLVLVSQNVGLAIGLLTTCQLISPRVSDSREKEWWVNHSAFYDPVPQIIYHYSCFILFIRSKSLKGRGIKFHLLKGRASKNLWMCLKTTIASNIYRGPSLCQAPSEGTGDPGARKQWISQQNICHEPEQLMLMD